MVVAFQEVFPTDDKDLAVEGQELDLTPIVDPTPTVDLIPTVDPTPTVDPPPTVDPLQQSI